MDKIKVQLILTMEEIDSLMNKLELFRDDPDAEHLKARIYVQQYPPEK